MSWLQASSRNIYHGLNENEDAIDTIIEAIFISASAAYGVMGREKILSTDRVRMTLPQAKSLHCALAEWIRDAEEQSSRMKLEKEKPSAILQTQGTS